MIYQWTISNIETYPEHAGAQDVVATVHWRVTATEGAVASEAYGSTTLELNRDNQFTPFAELTESQVIEWTKAAMKRPTATEVEEGLAAEIAMRATPSIVSYPLPWSN